MLGRGVLAGHFFAFDSEIRRPFERARSGLHLRIDFEADAVAEQCAFCAVECLAVRAVILAASAVVALARRAAAGAVRVEVAGLVAEDERRILVTSPASTSGVSRPSSSSKRLPIARDSARSIDAHHLVHAVEAVRAEIGDQPAGVVPEPAERAQEAAAIEGHRGRGAEVKIPVEAVGGSRVRLCGRSRLGY